MPTQGFFCDGTKYRKEIICNVYYYRISDFRLVSTGTYYLVSAPIFVQKSPVPTYVHASICALMQTSCVFSCSLQLNILVHATCISLQTAPETCLPNLGCTSCQGFFVTVRAGTAYRHLFLRQEFFLFLYV